MLARVAAVVFAIIQTLLLVRLALPYVHWPATLDPWIPRLIDVTDLLVAPFQPLVRTFDLKSAARDLPALGGVLTGYVDKLDAGVLVAMIGWGAIAFVVVLVVSLISRAR